MRNYTKIDSRTSAAVISCGERDASEQNEIDRANDDGWRFDDHLELRRQAEGMVHYLLLQSKKEALLVEMAWTAIGVRHDFADKQLFDQIAQMAGCVVYQMDRADHGRTRHMLFLGKNGDLERADYLESLP